MKAKQKIRRAIQDRWRAAQAALNQKFRESARSFRPTQMAIPLQMELNPEQLVAEVRRVLRLRPKGTF
jgi:hypothetical protein